MDPTCQPRESERNTRTHYGRKRERRRGREEWMEGALKLTDLGAAYPQSTLLRTQNLTESLASLRTLPYFTPDQGTKSSHRFVQDR